MSRISHGVGWDELSDDSFFWISQVYRYFDRGRVTVNGMIPPHAIDNAPLVGWDGKSLVMASSRAVALWMIAPSMRAIPYQYHRRVTPPTIWVLNLLRMDKAIPIPWPPVNGLR